MTSGGVRNFQAFGWQISSDLELPLPRASEPAPVDIAIVTDTDGPRSTGPLDAGAAFVCAASWGPGDTRPWYILEEHRDEFRLRYRSIGEFGLDPGTRTISWRPMPSALTHLAPVLLAGTVLAVLFTLEGRHVLHASAVAVGGRTAAFVGLSGQGKSTSAALCAAAGAQVVTDDVLLIESRQDGVYCRGSGARLRLREKAEGLATLFEGEQTKRRTPDGRLDVALPSASDSWLPLTTIALPRPSRTQASISTEAVTGSEALAQLLRSPRVDGMVHPDYLRAGFLATTELVERVNVLRTTIPWGPPWTLATGHELIASLMLE